MLLESPTSLNIPGGLSCNTMIKDKILIGLNELRNRGEIKNPLIYEAQLYTLVIVIKFFCESTLKKHLISNVLSEIMMVIKV